MKPIIFYAVHGNTRAWHELTMKDGGPVILCHDGITLWHQASVTYLDSLLNNRNYWQLINDPPGIKKQLEKVLAAAKL